MRSIANDFSVGAPVCLPFESKEKAHADIPASWLQPTCIVTRCVHDAQFVAKVSLAATSERDRRKGNIQNQGNAARVARAFRHIRCGFPLAAFTRSLEHERERLVLGPRAADLCLLGIHGSFERALHRSRFEPNVVAVTNNAIDRNPGAP